MIDRFQVLIDGYLDGTLSAAEEASLATWLRASSANAQRFAANVMLHDRLHDLHAAVRLAPPARREAAAAGPVPFWSRAVAAATALVTIAAVVALLAMTGIASRPASAAVVRLEQLIAAQAGLPGSTYRIVVESESRPRRRENQRRLAESRPPKPPLDAAVVHASGDRFVLVRTTLDGRPFITGSDGQTSWAISPDGPVRVSRDLERFNHDLPGHEYDMPLASLAAGLGRLRQAYDLRLEQTGSPSVSRLVASKRRGFRGPRQVEIVSADSSGLIESLRFVDMPYGPDRLTLRMELVETRGFEPGFFSHPAHHDPGREIVEE